MKDLFLLSTQNKIKPINSESLNVWHNQTHLLTGDLRFADTMLKTLNYEANISEARKQTYELDKIVAENNKFVQMNKDAYVKMAQNMSEHFLNLNKPNKFKRF